MSLKAFHIVFILASILLSTGVGFWGTGKIGEVPKGYFGMGVAAFVLGAALCAYLALFISKMKRIKSS